MTNQHRFDGDIDHTGRSGLRKSNSWPDRRQSDQTGPRPLNDNPTGKISAILVRVYTFLSLRGIRCLRLVTQGLSVSPL